MKGIMFRPWKIAAIAANPDKVCQTRRAIKPQPERGIIAKCPGDDISFSNFEMYLDARKTGGWIPIGERLKPRYRVGEVVYIKEALVHSPTGTPTRYLDGCPVFKNGETVNWKWKRETLSPMFMPAWAARYFIKILKVEPCRTKDISFEDCLAEGVIDSPFWQNLDYKAPAPLHPNDLSNAEADRETERGWIEYARQAYFALYDSINGKALYDSINGKGAHERNWDWKYIFRLTERPGLL